jgi:hypothetical protein
VLTERERTAVPSSEVQCGGSSSDRWGRTNGVGGLEEGSGHSWSQESERQRKKLGAATICALFPDAAGKKGRGGGLVGGYVGERKGGRYAGGRGGGGSRLSSTRQGN